MLHGRVEIEKKEFRKNEGIGDKTDF